MGRSASSLGAISAGKNISLLYATFANRPAANTVSSGQQFYAIDTYQSFYSDGLNWQELTPRPEPFPIITIDNWHVNLSEHNYIQYGNKIVVLIRTNSSGVTGGTTSVPVELFKVHFSRPLRSAQLPFAFAVQYIAYTIDPLYIGAASIAINGSYSIDASTVSIGLTGNIAVSTRFALGLIFFDQ